MSPRRPAKDDLDRARGLAYGTLLGAGVWVLAFVGLALLSGCATLKNTPQQDYLYAMAAPCERNGARISGVSPDGKSWRGSWSGGAYTWPEFQQCVREQMKARPYRQWLQEAR